MYISPDKNKWVGCLFFVKSLLFTGLLYAAPPDAYPALMRCQLAFPEAVKVSSNTIRIPFKWLGRLPIVQANIDSVQGTFIIDTGAERLLLNERYFQGNTPVVGHVHYGVTGPSKQVAQREVHHFNWENLALSNLTAHVLSLSHIEEKRKAKIIGIIGYEVLKDFEVLLDFPYQQIVLTRLDMEGNRIDSIAFNEVIQEVIPFELAKHGIILEAKIDKQRLYFNLDSGAEINLIDRKVPRKVLKHFKILKRINLIGTGNREVEVFAGTLANVNCGSQRNPPMRTLLTNLDELQTLLDRKIDGVLGFEFLRPRRTLINYKKREISFFKLVNP